MYCKLALLVFGAVALSSCEKPAFSTRIAVLRFENLTPDPAVDWIGRAISEEVAGQLEGARHHAVIPFATLHQLDFALGARPVSAPGISAERTAAIAAGANRLLTGFYTCANNQLRVAAWQENLDTHGQAVLQPLTGTAEDILHLSDTLARDVDEESTPAITESPRALRSYALALESAPDSAKPLFEQAIQLDPNFGEPYTALARMALQSRDSEAFAKIFEAVRQRGNGVRAVDRAELNLEDARLHASLSSRVDALSALVKLMPADPTRAEELGNAELEANRFAEAADQYRKLIALLPASTEPLNMLGYALMYSGDEAGSLKEFDDYQKAAPGDANALDSTGDQRFFFGHFSEAETLYLRAHEKNPALSGGAELLKAAWTRLMRNDATGATRLVDRYLAERAAAHDGLAPYRAAQVFRLIGKRDEAARTIAQYAARNEPHGATLNVREMAEAQLAWWHLLDGDGPGPIRSSPNVSAFEAVARKDYPAALPTFRKLAEEASPNEWWTRAVYARVLLATGQTQEARKYMKFTPIPQPSRTLSFDELWYPWILTARQTASGKVE